MFEISQYHTCFQEGCTYLKNNYKSVSIFRVFSKLFEKLLQKQPLAFFDNTLSNVQCGFRKVYGTQSYLLMMLQFFKDATFKIKAFGALLIDLSKAFDCICHDLVIAKLLCLSWICFRIIYHTVGKELKETPFLVLGKYFIWSTARLYPSSCFVLYFYVCHVRDI